jgi:acyl carrier protein
MTRETMRQTLESTFVDIVGPPPGLPFDESASMQDLGADSLEIVEVASRTMKSLRIRVPRTELSKARTIGELLDLLEATAAAKA